MSFNGLQVVIISNFCLIAYVFAYGDRMLVFHVMAADRLCNGRIKGGWGWRLSLGLAGIPTLLLTVRPLLVVGSPNSLIERGRLDEGKAVLRKIRGTDKIEPEFLELVKASRIVKQVKHSFRNLLK
ncbi:sugar transport protein 13-like [Gossypium hirsutum]|uniref:Sugar transport protein 13-like n=1 Tax=Gossypium hirsutum TaxID=3635 RepID=A0A1U8KRC7_GOSHI|nr:sugar transport protein 13-like [Gossypium hirsutum]